MDSLRDTIQETITAFVENNTAVVKKRDVSLFSVKLTDDCVREYRPRTLVNKWPQYFTSLSNAEYEAREAMELPSKADVRQDVTRTVIDAHQRLADVWIDTTMWTPDGSEICVEVIYSLEFTPDGKQIKRIIENVDSLLSAQFFEQALSNAGQN